MNKTELIDDAKRAVKSYVERELDSRGEKMIYPVISIKLDHDPEGEWDGINNAVIVSRDEKSGNIHLYVMTCVMHKEIIEKMFDTVIDDYVGHIVVDDDNKNVKYLNIVKAFSLESLRAMKAVRKKNFFGWDNI